MRNETYDKILQEARRRTLKQRIDSAAHLLLQNDESWHRQEASDYIQLIIEQWVEDGMPR